MKIIAIVDYRKGEHKIRDVLGRLRPDNTIMDVHLAVEDQRIKREADEVLHVQLCMEV